ncbi:PIG-L deacetylase family protein [Nocardioides sp. Bht2]|uniref:PIG-L deacetylase family protein n=1 Tax=Nocardioides sp. Bht2 TaxID=3392297 RepID=UPI0039B3804E
MLAIGAHTDDVELSCGATLSRMKRQGARVFVAALSRAEASLPPGVPVDELEREFRSAMALLGADDLHVGGFPVRNLAEHRQAVLDELITLRRRFEPDLVLTMNSADTHQDHAVVHQESLRAFRGVTMLGYELPWNQRTSANDIFVEVSPQDLERKVEMVAEYNTQAQLRRNYAAPEAVRAAAVFRGVQGRLPLAEMFECISVVWREL